MNEYEVVLNDDNERHVIYNLDAIKEYVKYYPTHNLSFIMSKINPKHNDKRRGGRRGRTSSIAEINGKKKKNFSKKNVFEHWIKRSSARYKTKVQ